VGACIIVYPFPASFRLASSYALHAPFGALLSIKSEGKRAWDGTGLTLFCHKRKQASKTINTSIVPGYVQN